MRKRRCWRVLLGVATWDEGKTRNGIYTIQHINSTRGQHKTAYGHTSLTLVLEIVFVHFHYCFALVCECTHLVCLGKKTKNPYHCISVPCTSFSIHACTIFNRSFSFFFFLSLPLSFSFIVSPSFLFIHRFLDVKN